MADLSAAAVLTCWRIEAGIVVGRITGHRFVPDGATVSMRPVEIARDRSWAASATEVFVLGGKSCCE
jgi:hypothetical protein